MSQLMLDYVTDLACVHKLSKTAVMYGILTGQLPAKAELKPGHMDDVWLHASIIKQLKQIAQQENISVRALIWSVVTGKRAPLKLLRPRMRKPYSSQNTVISVYADTAAWVSEVAHDLNINLSSVVYMCLHGKQCFTHICEWPTLPDHKKYSTIAVGARLYKYIVDSRIPGQSIAYTFHRLMEATQKPTQQHGQNPATTEAAPPATADKAEAQPVQSLTQDPAVMLKDLRARCRELLLEVMAQEFERIRKTITSI